MDILSIERSYERPDQELLYLANDSITLMLDLSDSTNELRSPFGVFAYVEHQLGTSFHDSYQIVEMIEEDIVLWHSEHVANLVAPLMAVKGANRGRAGIIRLR